MGRRLVTLPNTSTVAVYILLLCAAATEIRAEAWQPPRMAWGAPDLQGTWTTATITGLERMDEIDDLVLSEGSGVGTSDMEIAT